MTTDTDILIHPTGWDGYLRYATHDRGADWRPPFLSIPVGFIERLPDSLTLTQATKYLLFLCAYSTAPLLDRDGAATGPRRFVVGTTADRRPFVGRSSAVSRRIGQRLEGRDLDAWEKAGLVTFSTVGEPSADRRPTAQTRSTDAGA